MRGVVRQERDGSVGGGGEGGENRSAGGKHASEGGAVWAHRSEAGFAVLTGDEMKRVGAGPRDSLEVAEELGKQRFRRRLVAHGYCADAGVDRVVDVVRAADHQRLAVGAELEARQFPAMEKRIGNGLGAVRYDVNGLRHVLIVDGRSRSDRQGDGHQVRAPSREGH